MTAYTIILKSGSIVKLNHRENEDPVYIGPIPKEAFFKSFPNFSLNGRCCEIEWVIEGIYKDEIKDISQEVIDEIINENIYIASSPRTCWSI